MSEFSPEDLWLLEQERFKLSLERCAAAFRDFLRAWGMEPSDLFPVM